MDKTRLITLVQSVQRGNEAALTELYNEYYNDIYYYILKTLDSTNDPELAEDLTQDTFIEIIQTIDRLQDPAAFAAWSRKIAYHRCTAYFRKRRELLADEADDGSSIFDTLVEEQEEFIPGEALDKEDLKNTIQHMIDSLPEEQRSAIMMRYFDELPVQQIAQIQDTTEGTVKSRLNYGRKAIKKAVEDYEKRHGIRLHCAGVVPLLLWLFRMRKNELSGIPQTPAAAQSATPASAASKTASSLVKKSASASANAVQKATAGKIIAAVTAVAITAGAVGIGISQLTKSEKPSDNTENHKAEDWEENRDDRHDDSNSPVADYTYTEQTEDSDQVCGTWISEDGTLTVTYSGAMEGYWFEYQPSDGDFFDFIGDYRPEENAYIFRGWATTQGYMVEGSVNSRWDMDTPGFVLRCKGDTLLWELPEGAVMHLIREGGFAPQDDGVVYLLEDYPEYVGKVAEYHAAIFSADYSEEGSTLNTHILDLHHQFGDFPYFFYALEDIDSNGIPELFIGKSATPNGADIIDLYSISSGNLIQYFGNPNYGEKSWLSPLGGGMLMAGSSYSASSGGCTVYAISEDGSSVIPVASYTYYFPDQDSTPPEGNYMSYDDYQAATGAYEPYGRDILWTRITP